MDLRVDVPACVAADAEDGYALVPLVVSVPLAEKRELRETAPYRRASLSDLPCVYNVALSFPGLGRSGCHRPVGSKGPSFG